MNGDLMDERKEQLIEMVSDFCDSKLDVEHKSLCVNLIERIDKSDEISFKRGKLEIWASGIVYAIAQLNFLFDEAFEPCITVDDICDYFKTKKSSSYNKAYDIRKKLDLKLKDKELSSEIILNSNIDADADLNQVRNLQGAQTSALLNQTVDILKKVYKHRKSLK